MSAPDLPEPVRALLTAVLEAIDLPAPATYGGSQVHDRLLADRVVHAKIALSNALDVRRPYLGADWDAQYLRERLAEHPITGYVTAAQADAALDAGATWTEAVALPEGEGR